MSKLDEVLIFLNKHKDDPGVKTGLWLRLFDWCYSNTDEWVSDIDFLDNQEDRKKMEEFIAGVKAYKGLKT